MQYFHCISCLLWRHARLLRNSRQGFSWKCVQLRFPSSQVPPVFCALSYRLASNLMPHISLVICKMFYCGVGGGQDTATPYRLDGPGFEPQWGKTSLSPHPPWDPTSFLYNWHQDSLTDGKLPKRGTDLPPPSTGRPLPLTSENFRLSLRWQLC
jgi:hypothetical protein